VVKWLAWQSLFAIIRHLDFVVVGTGLPSGHAGKVMGGHHRSTKMLQVKVWWSA